MLLRLDHIFAKIGEIDLFFISLWFREDTLKVVQFLASGENRSVIQPVVLELTKNLFCEDGSTNGFSGRLEDLEGFDVESVFHQLLEVRASLFTIDNTLLAKAN